MLPLLLAAALCGDLPAPELYPPISDLRRFPPQEVARVHYEAASERAEFLHNALLAGLVPLEPAWEDWTDQRLRADAWCCLWSAHRWADIEYGRQQLRELRRILGVKDYFDGRMPNPVDLDRLTRVP